MNVSVAPYMPILLNCTLNEEAFHNLSLFDLPNYVTLYVVGKWDELLMDSESIMASYELLRLMLELPVVEVIPTDRSRYIKVSPDIMAGYSVNDRQDIRQQLYALFKLNDTRRIFAGVPIDVECLEVMSDKVTEKIWNFNPYGNRSLSIEINSFVPRLEQQKHSHENRTVGNKRVSSFSAYDRNNETYARELLSVAFIEHPGDIDDRTFLYTYDKKNKTFVEFRPDRNNVYHGMDISLTEARKKGSCHSKKIS